MGLQQRIGQLLQGDIGLRTDDPGQKPDVRGQLADPARCPALRFGGQTARLVLDSNPPDDRARPNPEHPPRSTTRMTGRNIAKNPFPKIKR